MKVHIEGGPIHEAFLLSQRPSMEDTTGVCLVWLSLYLGVAFDLAEKADDLEYVIERKGRQQTISLYVRDILVRQYDSRTGKIAFFFEEQLPKEKDMEKMLYCLRGAAYICAASPASLPYPVTRTK